MGKGGGDTSCIIHSLVAYEEKILASCSSPLKESAYDAQVCSVLSEKVLKKICARMHNHKKTYITEKYHFHYIMEDGIVFMCVAQAVHGQRLPFSFLKDIREKWHSKYRLRESMQARPYDMNQTFQSILKQKMLYYSDDTTDKLREVMEKVDDVKGTMLSNVDKILERGDALEQVARKAREIEEAGQDFKKVTVPFKRKAMCQNLKATICLCCLCTIFILGALYVAGVFVCGGWTLQKCTNAVWNAF